MPTVDVYYKDTLAGQLTRQVDDSYQFAYDKGYLETDMPGIAVTLPKRPEVFSADRLFPFFDGLIPDWQALISRSFLPDEKKVQFSEIIDSRMERLNT